MADDERGKKRGLRAKWRERKAHRAERAVEKSEGRARLWDARNHADGVGRTNTGTRVPRP